MCRVLALVETMEALLTDADCDLLVVSRVHPAIRHIEPALNDRRWFDLRRLHPARLLLRFVTAYEQAVRDFHAATKDLDEARGLVVLKGQSDPFHRHDLVMFWRARQAFDHMGIPYDWGCRAAMNRAAARGWSAAPQPNQLYSQTMALDIRDAWLRWCEQVYVAATDPWYRLENNVDHPDQVMYRGWLIGHCLSRSRQPYAFARALRDQHLALEHLAEDSRVSREVQVHAVALAKDGSL
jgi:hypothetical protein